MFLKTFLICVEIFALSHNINVKKLSSLAVFINLIIYCMKKSFKKNERLVNIAYIYLHTLVRKVAMQLFTILNV